MGGQKPPKPWTYNLGTIILMPIRLTPDDLREKIERRERKEIKRDKKKENQEKKRERGD